MASRSLGTLVLDLVARIGGFTGPLDKAGREVDKQSKKMQATMLGLKRAFGAAFGATSVTMVLSSWTRAFIAQEQAVAQVEAAIKSTGMAAGKTSEDIQRMASAMQAVSTFGDDEIMNMQAQLLTFVNVRGKIFDEASQAILDISTRMGQGLKESGVQIGKALQDPIVGLTALGRVGVKFTDEQKKLIEGFVKQGDIVSAQKVILKELEMQFGGAAKAARDTLGGAIAGLRNVLGDLGEQVIALAGGGKGAPGAINNLTEAMGGLEWVVRDVNSGVDSLLSNFRELGKYEKAFDSFVMAMPGVGPAYGIIEFLQAYKELRELMTDPANPQNWPSKVSFSPPPMPTETGRDEGVAAAIAKQIQALELQAKTFDMSATAAALYKLKLDGATAGELALAKAALDSVDAQKREADAWQTRIDGMSEQSRASEALRESTQALYDTMRLGQIGWAQDVVESLRTPVEVIQDYRKELDDALSRGDLTLEQHGQAYQKFADDVLGANDKIKDDLDLTAEFTKQAYANMQDSAAGFFEDVLNNDLRTWDDYVQSFTRSLNAMVANYLAQMAMMKAFGAAGSSAGGSGFLGSLLNIGMSVAGAYVGGMHPSGIEGNAAFVGPIMPRAAGGPVSAMTPYLVGEKGPELFMPRGAGNIVPNDKLGGDSYSENIIVHMNVSAMDSRSFNGFVMQNKEAIAAAISASRANNVRGTR